MSHSNRYRRRFRGWTFAGGAGLGLALAVAFFALGPGARVPALFSAHPALA